MEWLKKRYEEHAPASANVNFEGRKSQRNIDQRFISSPLGHVRNIGGNNMCTHKTT
jgi:hypothetical protein